MQSPTERKKGMRYLVAAAPFLAAALGLTTVAPAQESTQYSGVAAGDGVRIRLHVPDFLVVEDFVDAGAPTAQASIDGIGGSNGFASAPYPGQTVVTGGGTFAIATGIQLPGAYPWYTATAYPATPEKKVDQGPVFLESTSGAQSPRAQVTGRRRPLRPGRWPDLPRLRPREPAPCTGRRGTARAACRCSARCAPAG